MNTLSEAMWIVHTLILIGVGILVGPRVKEILIVFKNGKDKESRLPKE